MLQMEVFLRDDVFPSWFANALTKALSVMTSQFQLVRLDATHVQLPAGADAAAAMLSIGGLWRWVESPITLAHPGGAAGTYPVYATARDNNITASPAPFTDATDYSFQLSILAPGQTPTLNPGVIDVFRHVGDAVWDGAQITRVDQLAPPATQHAGRHAAGGPDPLTPAMIGAVPAADPSTAQTGDLIFSAALTRPGAVLCDGSAYTRTDPIYAALFAKIGTRYGVGNGTTTFNVPNYMGRVVVGAGTGAGLTPRALGAAGGEETHQLTVGEMPAHAHADAGHNHTASGGYATGVGSAFDSVGIPDNGINAGRTWQTATSFAAIQNAGGNGAHNNVQPFGTANIFIKL